MAKIGKDWEGLRDRLYGFTDFMDYVQTLQTQRTEC